jgi:pleiotropic regulator 1
MFFFLFHRERICKSVKGKDQYASVIAIVEKKRRELAQDGITDLHHNENGGFGGNKDTLGIEGSSTKTSSNDSSALTLFSQNNKAMLPVGLDNSSSTKTPTSLVSQKKLSAMPKPKWHAPWKLNRVISGHLGWVRCVTVEPGNEWYE